MIFLLIYISYLYYRDVFMMVIFVWYYSEICMIWWWYLYNINEISIVIFVWYHSVVWTIVIPVWNDDMILLNGVSLKETGALDAPALSSAQSGGFCGGPQMTAEHTRVGALWDRPMNHPLNPKRIPQRSTRSRQNHRGPKKSIPRCKSKETRASRPRIG